MTAATLFGIAPAVAAGVATVGLGARLVMVARQRSSAPVALASGHGGPDNGRDDGWELLGAGRLGRWALAALLAAHGLLLAAPAVIARWDSSRNGLYLVECVGFLLGLTALAGVAAGLRRHLGGRRGSRPAELADAVFLSSLALAVGGGLYAAARYRWASLWGAAAVAPYARTLVHGRPAPALLAGIPFAARLHIAAAFAAIATFPASRLGGAVVAGAWRIWDSVSVAAEAALRALVEWLRPQRLSRWLWPEDDLLDLARQTRRRAVARRRAGRVPGPAPAAATQEILDGLAVDGSPAGSNLDAPPLTAEGGG